MTPSQPSNDLRSELDEALLAMDELCADNPEEALSMFESLPPAVQGLPEFRLALARAHQAAGHCEAARDLANDVLSAPLLAADAHHLLGDVLEDMGDLSAANEHFEKALELDRLAFESSTDVEPSRLCDRVRSILDETVANLPEEIAACLQAASLEVQLFPSPEEVRDGQDPRALVSWKARVGGTHRSRFVLYAANLHAEFGDLIEFGEFSPRVRECIHREVVDFLELSAPESKRLGLLIDD